MKVQVTPERNSSIRTNTRMSTDELAMPMEKYEEWFDVIHANDCDQMSRIFSALKDHAERERYLNGWFAYEEAENIKVTRGVITRPLILAAACNSLKVMDAMIEAGADLYITEEDGSNIIHGLVVRNAFNHDKWEDILAVFRHIKNRLTKVDLMKLIMAENQMGQRPMEFAGQQCCFGLMMEIFNIVHVVKRQKIGIREHVWYDVTDYEFDAPIGRRHHSPIMHMANMDKGVIDCLPTSALAAEPMESWISAKFWSHLWSYCFWSLTRVLLVIFLATLDLDKSTLASYGGASDNVVADASTRPNVSFVYCDQFSVLSFSQTARMTLLVISTVISIISLCFATVRHGRRVCTRSYKERFFYLPNTRHMVKEYIFYDLCSACLCVSSVVYCVIWLINEPVSIVLMSFLRIIVTATAIFSILYVLQVLPIIGPFIITIEKMLASLLRFSFVFIVMVVPFVTLNSILFNTLSKTCVEEFSTFPRSVFATFRTMLNMVSYAGYSIEHHYIIDTVHMIYVFFIAILLLNFLIAFMSNAVNEVEDRKQIVTNVQRLEMVFNMEEVTVSWPKLHEWFLRRHFTMCDERFCIVVTRCASINERKR